ncbi:MAG: Peptidase E [Microgenomates group bacterium GW2011_GWA1_48_10]|uniref:Peptidase E n=1 Tax=Candidatus Gottesmanbacteria bacterium RIFCSPHIGHO2_01_FULL_47_48 TaxID=1798381 RepID=A0A1F6A5S2_9BACT|nr:MAG: Peptidase E [Microgenomates group bacterium GW2011_GWA1_48_10]OGG19627.1 MAG: hypothetical protein A2721_03070 [Candidatus Gottesmanbacteria bacterium RIFCSPHIGHO2_01_FULL_47_48]
MKLLLTSAGLSTAAIKKKFLELISKKTEEISVAFVAMASDVEEDKSYVEKDKELFAGIGVKLKDVDLKNKTMVELKEEIKNVDAIFVEGGNTFYLLYWIRRSGFDEVIEEMLSKGKVYVGASAGSIILGPSIETSGWEGGDRADVVELDSLEGLGLVNFGIYPHVKDDQREFLEEKGQKLSYKLILLTDEQAVVVEDSRWGVI